MQKYLVDTVAFLSYLADVLPFDANEVFKLAENNEAILLIPSIVMGEILYTIYKGKEIFGKKIPIEKIELIFEILKTSVSMKLAYMELSAWEIFRKIEMKELHDRMIVATARSYRVNSIITSDPEIKKIEKVLW